MKTGFIGTGNMGGAILKAVVNSDVSMEIFISNRTLSKSERLAREFKVNVSNNREIFEICDYIFIGVKPVGLSDLLSDAKDLIKKRKTPPVIISMVSGRDIAFFKEYLGDIKIIRILPNTPVEVGAGMTVYCSENISDNEEKDFLEMMKKSGTLITLSESLIDKAGILSGCAPAFCDLFLEALSDGGTAIGLSRKDALNLAATTMLGAAKLYLDTKKHPGELKDAVTSPGGSTIQGVIALENGGMRSAVINAVIASYNKTLKM